MASIATTTCGAQLTRDFVTDLLAFRASWYNVARHCGYDSKLQTRERWIPRNNFSLYKLCQRTLVDLWNDPLNHSHPVYCEYDWTFHEDCVNVIHDEKFLEVFPTFTLAAFERLNDHFGTLGTANKDPDNETRRLLTQLRLEFCGSTLDTFRDRFPGLPLLLLEDLVEFALEYYLEGIRLCSALPEFPHDINRQLLASSAIARQRFPAGLPHISHHWQEINQELIDFNKHLPAPCYLQEFNFAIQYHVRIHDPSSAVPDDPTEYFKFRRLVQDCPCILCKLPRFPSPA